MRFLRSQNWNVLFCSGYLVLGIVATRTATHGTVKVLVLVMALLGMVAWLMNLRRARAMVDMATSRIGCAAQGYVEVQGQATEENFTFSPFSAVPCIWYRYRVYSRDAAGKPWREVSHTVSGATFEITDATGACRVDPEHAEVLGAQVRTSYHLDDKHVEELLFAGRMVYVLGEFFSTSSPIDSCAMREDVSQLLDLWKQDARQLHRRFDLDGDAQISLKEWELARRLATKMVEREHHAIQQQPTVRMLRAPRDGRLFLISTLSPQNMRKRYLVWSGTHLGVSLLLTLALLRLFF